MLASEMTPRMVSALVGLLLVSLSGSVLADYKQDYARGQQAATDENWAEVERYMQEALAGSATPVTRVRLYGQRFAPYVPQYYLGLAALRSNDCAGALRWFQQPQAAAVIAQIEEFKGVADDAVRQCKAAVAVQPKPTTPTNPPPTPPNNPPPVKPATPDPKPVAQQPSKPPSTGEPASAPASLQTAIGDYLAGRFSAASRATTTGVNGKAKAHLHLLRAASLFALSEIDSGQSARLRQTAQQEVRLAKQSQAGLSPDASFFSPRFRAFFTAN